MYKHAKSYSENKLINIGDPPFNLEDLKLHILNRYKYKYNEVEIDCALDKVTKGQLKRFKRYGSARLPVPIQELLSK